MNLQEAAQAFWESLLEELKDTDAESSLGAYRVCVASFLYSDIFLMASFRTYIPSMATMISLYWR